MEYIRVIIVLLLAVFGVFGVNLDYEWSTYTAKYGKKYDNLEVELSRRMIFEKNYRMIQMHNRQYRLGKKKYFVGIQEHSDLTQAEFLRKRTDSVKRETIHQSRNHAVFRPKLGYRIPDEVDWRDQGYVTEVKQQFGTTWSWAFSATGALEGQWMAKTGSLISLSEQNLIDCVDGAQNGGCKGGSMEAAFTYMENGVESEEDYPYTAADGSCQYDSSEEAAEDSGFDSVEQGSEDELQAAVASVGPISVAIDASQESFGHYQGGVYDEPSCSSTQLNHGVLVVGYGAESDGTEYYIVKNSWGEDWGEDGYVRMSRNKDNQCGIATDASYPTVD